MELVVARVGRAQGLRGEVNVEVRTDDPQARFVPGAVFATDPSGAGPLTLRGARDQSGRLVLAFEGVDDRTAAEGLRGVLLLVELSDEEDSAQDDAWYDHQLVGLQAVTLDGAVLGAVAAVEHFPAQDLLVVRTPAGDDVLVPFVAALVPEVDIGSGRVVLDPPGGLFEDLA